MIKFIQKIIRGLRLSIRQAETNKMFSVEINEQRLWEPYRFFAIYLPNKNSNSSENKHEEFITNLKKISKECN